MRKMSDLFRRKNGRLTVDIEDVLEAHNIVREFNNCSFDDMDILADGKKIEISEDKLFRFRNCGLLNIDYFIYFDEEWRKNYED